MADSTTIAFEATDNGTTQGSSEASFVSQVLTFEAFDGYPLTGRLTLPAGMDSVKKLVIYVNGSGPNTYLNHRQINDIDFNYFDFFAEEYAKRNTAFFSYNTRGVSLGEEPPLFQEIDEAAYQSYLPHNEIQDVATMIKELRTISQLHDAQIILLGWSAGTIVSPLVVLETDAPVDVLLLAGYTNTTMDEALDWQQTGGSSMVFYRNYFDYDGDRRISPEEFTEDRYGIAAWLGVQFTDLDADANGYLDEHDFALLLQPSREALYAAINRNDDEWLKNNYGVQLTSAWFEDYRTIAPNSETLPKVDIPIYIFHGNLDANVPVEQVHAIEQIFKTSGKSNLTSYTFGGHDHDLNFVNIILTGTIPEGIQTILDCVDKL